MTKLTKQDETTIKLREVMYDKLKVIHKRVDEILLYGEYTGVTSTNHNTYECDTQAELDTKVIELGFDIPDVYRDIWIKRNSWK
jgi:hypothetical protein